MNCRPIVITAEDREHLEGLLGSMFARVVSHPNRFNELRAELDRARIVSPADVPEDVVTMNSTVTLRDLDTNETETYTLVYPDQADIANHRLSVLAPVGTAVLGYRVGDELRWRVPAGWRRLKVEQVLFQPERDAALYM